jgi:transposase
MASVKNTWVGVSIHFPNKKALKRIRQAAKIVGESVSSLTYQAARAKADEILAEDAKKTGKCPQCGQAAA